MPKKKNIQPIPYLYTDCLINYIINSNSKVLYFGITFYLFLVGHTPKPIQEQTKD